MNAPTPTKPARPRTEASVRKALAKHRAAMAAQGLYPVVVRAVVVADGLKVVEVPGDAAHPTIDPQLVGDVGATNVRVRFRRETLWAGGTVKRGEFVTVPLSQVTWLN